MRTTGYPCSRAHASPRSPIARRPASKRRCASSAATYASSNARGVSASRPASSARARSARETDRRTRGASNPSPSFSNSTGRSTRERAPSACSARPTMSGAPWAMGQVYVPAPALGSGRCTKIGAKKTSTSAPASPCNSLTGAQAPGAAQVRSPSASVSRPGRSTSTR